MEPNTVLEQALSTVASRGQVHGNADILFTNIAERWSLTLSQKYGVAIALTAADVAFMMLDFKMARAIANPANTDNPVDLAGYASLLGSFTAAA